MCTGGPEFSHTVHLNRCCVVRTDSSSSCTPRNLDFIGIRFCILFIYLNFVPKQMDTSFFHCGGLKQTKT